MALDEYQRKRNFRRTPEPRGGRPKKGARTLQFVVQKHAASRLHYDFRLELDGVLKSWAVPKGPSLVAGEKRMAVEVEDHPLDYASFEGVIPKGEYGGGTVLVWDRGVWDPLDEPHAALAKGDLSFQLSGDKLRGRWHLVRMRPRDRDRGRSHWLLIKASDAEARRGTAGAITERAAESVLTGRGLDEVANDADRVWSSKTGERDAPAIAAPGDPSALPGARRLRMPRTVAPQLATLVTAAPDGEDWLHEIKFDGYRLVCRIERGKARLYTRAGKDWTDSFPSLAASLEKLPLDTALLDGEAVVFDAEGRSRFQLLQNALGGKRADFQLALFDLLYLDGFDLRGAPLIERKRLLRQLLARGPSGAPLRYSDDVHGRGAAFFEAACKRGVEGIVSKRADAPYGAGRSRAWLKVKCLQRQEFVIVGFTAPARSRVGFGALLIGAHDADGALRYCGKVGTGFDDAMLATLHARLAKLERDTPPVIDPRRAERGARWVTPRLVAEISFTEWTDDGKLRHPVFVGLRTDKKAEEVRIETPAVVEPAAPALASEVAGVRLSNPDRVYWPDVGVTKSELALYYEAVAERMLPLVRERPLTMLRCPEGIDGHRFYQKHAGDTVPATVARVAIEKGEDPYAMVTDLASLVSLAQIGVLEFHVWGARADRLDRPDLLVFDLDPDPSVPWRRVADTAQVLRALCAELALVPFLRTTGGKGLHVVVPLVRRASWDEVKRFTHAIARLLVEEAPDQFVAVMTKSRREGKIFIDYLRNAPESTAIASYSTRARPGAPIAMPIAWEELDGQTEALQFGLRDAAARLAEPDPWRDFESSRRPLGRAALRRVGVG